MIEVQHLTDRQILEQSEHAIELPGREILDVQLSMNKIIRDIQHATLKEDNPNTYLICCVGIR